MSLKNNTNKLSVGPINLILSWQNFIHLLAEQGKLQFYNITFIRNVMQKESEDLFK